MKRILIAVSVLIITSCSGNIESEKKWSKIVDQMKAKLDGNTKALQTCQTKNKELTSSLANAKTKLNSANARIKKLLETPESKWKSLADRTSSITTSMEAAQWIIDYDKFARDNPDSPIVGNTKGTKKQVEKTAVSLTIKESTQNLSDSDKSTYERAIQNISNAIIRYPRNPENRRAKRVISQLKRDLGNWPVKVNNLKQMKLRYADLRDKFVIVGPVAIQAFSYYNCYFRSQSRWRNFRMGDANNTAINVYCRRGDTLCEKLFMKLTDGTTEYVRFKSVVLYYPRRNSVCEEDQAILSSYTE